LPNKILNAPELLLGLEIYWEAYAELTTCRPMSFGGPLPIPWTAIISYAHECRFDASQTDNLIFFVKHMDKTFLTWCEKRDGNNKKS
jgi:hypothetical protein